MFMVPGWYIPWGEDMSIRGGKETVIENRLKQLEKHLEQENPVLLTTVQSFRELDRIAYRLGILKQDESFATHIPWWPLISVLGVFSAGKSTFINHYLGMKLQRSGNQAVDDKFSVICYSSEQTSYTLPGVALDSDPRFPFYKMSSEIDKVAQGEGDRIDAYLQLKTCPSEKLRGKILIDSPGFDADAQRTSTLRITDHIINLSDLVLVFFDARHPEPGAMRDTLDHLVTSTIKRNDSGKFLYILNQLDTTALEDNPEEVVAAWQRALGERGLTAGRFYTTYNSQVAVPITDEALRRRFESKRDADLGEIHGRMQQVETERAYRIVGTLEKTASDIEEQVVPAIQSMIDRWRKRVLIVDAVFFSILIGLFLVITNKLGQWDGLQFQAEWWHWVTETNTSTYVAILVLYCGMLAIHYTARKLAAKSLINWVKGLSKNWHMRCDPVNAFIHNTKPWRSIFSSSPAGWGRRSKRGINKILEDTDHYVQSLNDRFTNPSGTQPSDAHASGEDDSQAALEEETGTEKVQQING